MSSYYIINVIYNKLKEIQICGSLYYNKKEKTVVFITTV